jgi:hypothetical protein
MPRTEKSGMERALSLTPMPMPQFDIEPLIAVNQRGVKAAAEAQDHMLRRVSAMSDEVFRFLDRRLERDREVVRELSSCRSPQDAVALYGQYFEETMKQYSEEMGLLAGLYSDQAREALEDAQHQIEDGVGEAQDQFEGAVKNARGQVEEASEEFTRQAERRASEMRRGGRAAANATEEMSDAAEDAADEAADEADKESRSRSDDRSKGEERSKGEGNRKK